LIIKREFNLFDILVC